MQRRQIKDIEEKVHIGLKKTLGNFTYCNDAVLVLTRLSLCFSLVFVPLSVFLLSIYSLALIQEITDPHQVTFAFVSFKK